MNRGEENDVISNIESLQYVHLAFYGTNYTNWINENSNNCTTVKLTMIGGK